MEERFDRFTSAIAGIYQDIRKIKLAEMEHYDLRSGHVDCLHILASEPEGLTSKELAEHVYMDKAAVSRYMSILEERGFVKLEETDARIYRRKWQLTPKGKTAADHIQEQIGSVVSTIGDFLNETERAQLYSILEKIASNLHAYAASQERSTD